MAVGIRIGIFAALFLLIGQAAAWMNSTGFTWRLLSPRLVDHQAHQLEAFLFALERKESALDVLIIGDRGFLDRAVQNLPAGKSVETINLLNFRLDTLARLFRLVPHDKVKTFVLQNSPLAWSDYRYRGVTQSVRLWSTKRPWRWVFFPVDDVRTVFRSVADTAGRGAVWLEKQRQRHKNLDELHFLTDRKELTALETAMRRHGMARAIWVEDFTGYDRSSNPDLFKAIAAYAVSKEAKERFGRFVDFTGLGAALK